MEKMTKVKIFRRTSDVGTWGSLEYEMNNWLESHANTKIIDIKYSVCLGKSSKSVGSSGTTNIYSAMIIYEE